MPMPPEAITALVEKAFPHAAIELVDVAGDQDHYVLTVTSPEFRGKSLVQQHKMVYEALAGHAGTTIHSVQVKTRVGSL